MRTENRRLPLDSTTKSPHWFSTNWWIGLEILHTLFALEHNAICDRSGRVSGLSDEQLFQIARLINAALMAKIHTVEWTPAILGHPTPYRHEAIGGVAGATDQITGRTRRGVQRHRFVRRTIRRPFV
jgi:hypothetical protein